MQKIWNNMSRLYDEWKKTAGDKLPRVFRKKDGEENKSTVKPIVISIPLKGGSEPVELTENFLKVIEREYAVRYLESIGVDPTRKHIEKLLEDMPLDNCEIKARWRQTSGWLADVIDIYPRCKQVEQPKTVSNNLASRLESQPTVKELPKEELGLTLEHFRNADPHMGTETEADEKIQIDLNIHNIKQNYLYPFMAVSSKQEFTSKYSNFALLREQSKDMIERAKLLNQSSEDLLDSKVFKFPFESITVATAHIKEMMQPIEISAEDVEKDIKYVLKNFPLGSLPIQVQAGERGELLKSALANVESENNARLIGLVSHFCYWTVFSHLHSIGINDEQRQQMFITILHLFHDLELKSKSRKQLYLAVFILIMRMIVENIFVNSYKQFFAVPAQKKIACEKIQFVITKLFDPECFYSRISFLESGIDALSVAGKARSKMSAKYYSTSSVVKSLFPNPQHPRTRALLAKKEAYEGKLENMVKTAAQIEGTMPLLPGKLNYYQQTEPWKTDDYLDIPSRAHLFMLTLQKMKKTSQ
ncbi:unnamed protein product [Blepharisma stoltei]|uniref:Uncharacterized protein n=1 Tax=Blepharisma stoltei TaxID=1481888 RepID=A0AAU9JG83_9CILI|nr:unnamed protein product [Blepharisma stoltei]